MRRRKGTGRKLQSSLYGQRVWSLFVWGKARHRNHFFFAISDALWIFSCLHGAADARDDSNKSSCKRLTKDAVHQHLHTSRWKPPLFNGGGGIALNHAFCFFFGQNQGRCRTTCLCFRFPDLNFRPQGDSFVGHRLLWYAFRKYRTPWDWPRGLASANFCLFVFGLIPQNLTPTRDNNHRYDELAAETKKK